MRNRTVDRYRPELSALERRAALAGTVLASFPRRAAALFVDFALAALAFVALVPASIVLADRWGWLHLDRDVNLHLDFFHNWYSVLWLVAYFTLASYWGHGRTPGKRLLRIRIVSLVHDHLTFWHALERALGYGASVLEGGFGFLQYFLRKGDRQTVHDRIAETLVVADSPPQAPSPEAGTG